MRIAFLTPEYPSEIPDAGGLGNYLHRLAKLLIRSGHEAEVFVVSRASESLVYDDVPIHRVGIRDHALPYFAYRVSTRLFRSRTLLRRTQLLLQAWTLARTLEEHHLKVPFDLVQSSDYEAVGLFVRRRHDRAHVVRCSTAADLYNEYDQLHEPWFSPRLERLAIRSADIAYAPSQFVASHFLHTHGIQVRVVRPPIYQECSPSDLLPLELPPRFFFHFGQLCARKGTTLLAEALPAAWKTAPDLTMVWSGHLHDKAQEELPAWRARWGVHASQVYITSPLKKPDLYAVLQQSDVAVLPSQIDNLPNTVVESLMFGIPVLGSRGASIDELVEEGHTGHLVPLGDAEALGAMLAHMWNCHSPVRKGFEWDSPIAEEMKPSNAISSVIRLREALG